MAISHSERQLPCGRKVTRHAPIADESKLAQWQKQLRDYLSSRGLKYTEQRWKIVTLILSAGGHLDAQGIVERVKSEYPEIGAATVYRNIKVLCDASILKESLNDSEGRVVYELFDDAHHDHIVCTDCREIFEFHSEKIERLQTEVLDRMKFDQVRHRHVIYAKCQFENKT